MSTLQLASHVDTDDKLHSVESSAPNAYELILQFTTPPRVIKQLVVPNAPIRPRNIFANGELKTRVVFPFDNGSTPFTMTSPSSSPTEGTRTSTRKVSGAKQ